LTESRRDLTGVRYLDSIQEALQLSPEELAQLAENSFIVTDRLAFDRFKRAYAWIYWKDLPVLVTTDSILHVIHYGYDHMVKWLEAGPLYEGLRSLLTGTRDHLRTLNPADANMALVHADLDFYLTISVELFKRVHGVVRYEDDKLPVLSPEIDDMLARIRSTSAHVKKDRDYSRRRQQMLKEKIARGETLSPYEHEEEVSPEPVFGIEELTVFGVKRKVDMSQFTPRGHYVDFAPRDLETYFWVMMWLALIDFPLTQVDRDGTEHVLVRPLAAAHLLRDCIDAVGQRDTWKQIDEVLRALVGWSDNITLDGLDTLIADLGARSPAVYFSADPDQLLARLRGHDCGQSRIAGRVLNALDEDHETPAPMPLSFALMGQRFTLESWIMQELVFDHLMVGGLRIQRAYPNPLDVMAALGNDRASDHLGGEFAKYHYEARLAELRDQITSTSFEFWENSFYNRWLNIIRTLNQPDPAAPPVTHSSAWADKSLHTQLAAWTQLRHDNILFVKQSYTLYAVCEYPAGYVEPYPAFYAAVADYAQFAKQMLVALDHKPEDAKSMWGPRYEDYTALVEHFTLLVESARTLQTLAEKELRQELFTDDETLFLRSVVVRKYVNDPGYGGSVEEEWHGWYSDLVGYDHTPALIADLHANVDYTLGPVGVLHTATGTPVVEVMLVDDGTHQAAYVGPSFTYYELLQSGDGLHRLDDVDWQALCDASILSRSRDDVREAMPTAPEWVTSFRVLHSGEQQFLNLPARQELSPNELTANDQAAPEDRDRH
jgi:hypothetical protein